MGMKKAAVAVAHRILIILFRIIGHGEEYREFGGDHFDRRSPTRTARRLLQRLERLGFDITQLPMPRPHEPGDKRHPGRPCKCLQRGIPCVHQLPKSEKTALAHAKKPSDKNRSAVPTC
jgi:hypothetical protein